MSRDVIITGPPRSGTTLVCHLLNTLPDVVALHEPMNLAMFAPPVSIPDLMEDFFAAMRREIAVNGRALSKIAGGKVPDNPFPEGSGVRKSRVEKGYFSIEKPLSDDFTLCIKHNAHFTFSLEKLVGRYPVYVVLRNPISTLASWSSIDAPVAEGRVKVLYHLKPELAAQLDAIDNILDRQIALLDLHFRQYLTWRDHLTFIRYEDVVLTGGSELACIDPAAGDLREPLSSKNALSRYGSDALTELVEKTAAEDLCFWKFYDREEVLKLI